MAATQSGHSQRQVIRMKILLFLVLIIVYICACYFEPGFADQMRADGTNHDAQRAAAWAKPAAFTAERDQLLGVTIVAPDSQKPVFESAELEKIDKLALHERGQRPPLPTHELGKLGIVLLNDLVEQCVLGPVPPIPMATGRRVGGRNVSHASRPCDGVGCPGSAYLDMFYGLMLRPLVGKIHRD